MGLSICSRSKHDELTMDLQLGQREKQGICILDLDRSLTIGDSEAMFRNTMVTLAEAGTLNIILNLAGVTEIDEDGLSALIFCHARITESGGALKLLHLRPDLSLIVTTQLGTEFEVFTNEQDAVNSFFPDRAVRHYDILQWVQGQEKRRGSKVPK